MGSSPVPDVGEASRVPEVPPLVVVGGAVAPPLIPPALTALEKRGDGVQSRLLREARPVIPRELTAGFPQASPRPRLGALGGTDEGLGYTRLRLSSP